MTNSMCAKSIFHWTNETINIWSHLLGFIYFTYCQYEMNAYRIPLLGGHFQDHLIISLSLFGAQEFLRVRIIVKEKEAWPGDSDWRTRATSHAQLFQLKRRLHAIFRSLPHVLLCK
ncbi:hypothetical protein Y032_0018g3672 [Ancylostoma ceylanicum]|nr:hypothetical protein Y032_0018g3672 [Ancylostoma ceylanicum]